MRILLVAYAPSPRRGSEPGSGWNWAWHLSEHHKVWVLAYPEDRVGCEEFLATHPRPNLRFVWVETIPSLDQWSRRIPGLVSRFGYEVWQRAVFRVARRLHAQIGFDIAHHVSFGSVSSGPLLWRLGIPFVWGPVGGGQVTPPAFKSYFGPDWRGEVLRTTLLRAAMYAPSVRLAARRSALALATNRETESALRRLGAARVELFLDTGIPERFLSPEAPSARSHTGAEVTLLWVGKLERRRALPLALEALAKCQPRPRLLVAGEGPLRAEWENLAVKLGLGDRVKFLGLITYGQMPALYRSADVFIFTSLRDSFGAQVLEAMGAGLPVVTLDHQGVGTFVPEKAAFKVPVKNPEETVAGLVEAIRTLMVSPELRAKMGRVA